MTCREFTDFIASYLDAALDEPLQAQFEFHLSVCENCVRYLDQYRQTIAAGRAAFTSPDDPVPDDVPPGLIEAILASRRG